MLFTTVCAGFTVRGGVGGGHIDETSVGVVDAMDGELEIGDDEDDMTALIQVPIPGSTER